MYKPLSDPIKQFAVWFEMARNSSIDKPNAMVLSTSDGNDGVSSRMVLLSSFSDGGFVFHTNYLSRKGREIDDNNRVALLFWWDELGYQIRIAGEAEKTSESDSDDYFAGRLRGSQIVAWASEQSQVIGGRSLLEQRVIEFTDKFRGGDVPRPPHWGGYCVKPYSFEFWINREDRLHDRFRYEKAGQEWSWSRLAP